MCRQRAYPGRGEVAAVSARMGERARSAAGAVHAGQVHPGVSGRQPEGQVLAALPPANLPAALRYRRSGVLRRTLRWHDHPADLRGQYQAAWYHVHMAQRS